MTAHSNCSSSHHWLLALVACMLCLAPITDTSAQNSSRAANRRAHTLSADSTQLYADSLNIMTDSLAQAIDQQNKQQHESLTSPLTPQANAMPVDSLSQAMAKRFIPNPTKATWMALVIPGGGQIYNRKFWKLPIFYAGFAGCAYALNWNGRMYKDYSNAYKDAVNNDWESKNITDLIPPNYLSHVSQSQLTDLLRKRKDTYRRYRDLSIFAFIGVYLLSVVDAYVDAELSNFDITPDLSMRVEPAMLGTNPNNRANRSVGLQCSFNF